MKNHLTVGWFEIPVEDMDRAILFYNQVFEIEIKKVSLGNFEMGWFPFEHGPNAKGAPGSLVKSYDNYKPSSDGPLLYFSSADVSDELSKVEKAGGKLLQEKKQISEDHGFMGIFIDTEGNRIAVHSNA